jgi:hypothetical protein
VVAPVEQCKASTIMIVFTNARCVPDRADSYGHPRPLTGTSICDVPAKWLIWGVRAEIFQAGSPVWLLSMPPRSGTCTEGHGPCRLANNAQAQISAVIYAVWCGGLRSREGGQLTAALTATPGDDGG